MLEVDQQSSINAGFAKLLSHMMSGFSFSLINPTSILCDKELPLVHWGWLGAYATKEISMGM